MIDTRYGRRRDTTAIELASRDAQCAGWILRGAGIVLEYVC